MRLIFTMIVNRLTEKLDFQGSEQLRNKHRLLFLIDEFPSLKRMEIFADALSYMAGFGLKAYLITQDIRQIVDEYGRNESIVSNCQVRVFAPNQYDTAELLSKMTGTQTIRKASFNFRIADVSRPRPRQHAHGRDRASAHDAGRDHALAVCKERGGNQEKSLLPAICLFFFPGTTLSTVRRCSISLTPSCAPALKSLRRQSFMLFTTEDFRPRTHSGISHRARSQHRDHAHTAVCRLRLAVALAQTRQSTNPHHLRAPLFGDPQVYLTAWI
jgi:hypothetical protein